MISAAVSVASYSVVLAETFAAVGLATIVPNTFAVMARLAVGAASTLDDPAFDEALDGLSGRTLGGGGALPVPSPGDAIRAVMKAIAKGAANVDKIDLLVPKTASIDSEFEFQANEQFSGAVSIGAQVQVVTINAGYSALYQSSSKNKVKMHIDYVTVEVPLR